MARYRVEPSLAITNGTCATNSTDYNSVQPHNCSKACFDPSTLFLPFNLDACVGLAAGAMLIQNGSLELNESDSTTQETLEWFVVLVGWGEDDSTCC